MIAKVFRFLRLVLPGDLAPDFHGDFTGGVGGHFNGAEIHFHHERSPRAGGDNFVEGFLRVRQGDTRREGKNQCGSFHGFEQNAGC